MNRVYRFVFIIKLLNFVNNFLQKKKINYFNLKKKVNSTILSSNDERVGNEGVIYRKSDWRKK